MNNIIEAYLHLLKGSLSGSLYNDTSCGQGRLYHWLKKIIHPYDIVKKEPRPGDGTYWPSHGLTMVGDRRLENIRLLLEQVEDKQLCGSYVECGVWKGGTLVWALGLRKALNLNRSIIGYDSFNGLPPATIPQDKAEGSHVARVFSDDSLKISETQVWTNILKYGFPLNSVTLRKGWFKDTLPHHKTPIAILRCDGDWYESTMDILTNLYKHVEVGGYIIIDDYYTVGACRQAVNDFWLENGLQPTLVSIDYASVYWRKA